MADKTINDFDPTTQATVPVRFVDNLDGSYSQGVAIENAGIKATVDTGNSLRVSSGGGATGTVPATTAGNTVIKATPGRVCRVLATTTGTGTGTVNIYDNATTNSGTIIGQIAANAAAGTLVDIQMPAAAGITVAQVTNGPALTIAYF